MRRSILVSFLAGLALFALISRSDGQTIKIGAVVPLTGRYAALGSQVKTGYELAVQHINAAGGVTVGGKKLQIEMTMLDDESDPTKTVARLETLATQGVVAYLGGAGSDLHGAAASIGDKNKIPYLGVGFRASRHSSTGPALPLLAVSEVAGSDQGNLCFLDALIPAAQRPRKVALFLERTDWGKEMGSGWQTAAKKHGYQVVASGEYAPGSKDFSDLILKAKVGRCRSRARPTVAARRHDDRQADEGTGFQHQGQPLYPRRRSAGVVAKP